MDYPTIERGVPTGVCTLTAVGAIGSGTVDHTESGFRINEGSVGLTKLDSNDFDGGR